jgi:four helix bundle protein
MYLAEIIYKLTAELPKEERFGLSSQMQRAGIGIPSNIAEGSKRNHTSEFIYFLSIANGSAAELETQLILTRKIYPNLNEELFNTAIKLTEEILKMLYTLTNSLKK